MILPFEIAKEKIKIGISVALILLGLVSLVDSIRNETSPRPEGKSITFILGEDNGDHQFYTLGLEYFRVDSVDRTDTHITHVRSLEQMIYFLNNNKPEQPFDRIEIVVHGNVWSGLSVSILDGGERAYPKELLKAVLKDKLPKLATGIINESTKVNIWGCGIGTNPLLRYGLDSLFKDEKGISPSVNPSSQFVIFKRPNPGAKPVKIQADYWPYFFKRGYRPSESEIEYEMKKKFPESLDHWNNSQEIDSQDLTQSFENEFHVPISWTVIYASKEDCPSVSSEDQKMEWIKNQKGLMKKIDELSIPIDKYNWTVNKIIHTNEKGEKVPAIKAIGMSTVLCVVSPSV